MWSLLALLAILWNYGNCQVCVTDSLDLAFILDASTSVTEPNFRRMLQFVQNIVSELDIDSGATRVALLTFSTNTKIQYNLGEISNKAEFIDKIRTISYDYGSTNTADALVAMRTKVFSKSRDRPHVPNVAILITDGISNINGQRTVTDAEDARAAGITIVGVGIALTDTSELDRIVSQPVEKYKYSVDEFDKLDEIAKLLLTMDCKEAPDTDRPDATIDLYQGIGSNPADIVFLLDTSTSNDVDLYNKIRSFLVHFVESSSVESGEVRFAFVPYTNYPDVKFYLNKYSRKADIVTAIRDATFNYGERNTADAFDLLRRQVFTEGNGDRPQVPNIVLMITTGTSDRNSFRTIQEAEALRFAGVGIFAIGVGLTNAREIEAMASRPTRENTFQLASVDELEAIRDIVFAQIFTRAEQSFKSPVTGSEQLDLIFLLHFSNNMRKESLNLVLDFVQNLLEYADIDSGQVRVGISIYRKTATSLYNLDRFSTKGELMEGIEQITTQYKAKAANTAAGLDFLRTDMFVEKAGDRPNVPNAVIIITDANTNVDQADAITAAEALKATGTAIFSIGIGLENPDELDALATSRDFSLALTQTSELNSNTIYIQDRIVALRTQADLPMPPPTITSPTFTKTTASALDIRNTRRPPALVENDLLRSVTPVSTASAIGYKYTITTASAIGYKYTITTASAIDREEADVVLAFHCSKETKVKDFKKGLFTLFSELVSSADVDSGAVRFALVGYGQNASVIFGFNSYQRKKKLLKALKKVKATYRSKESNALDLILKLKTEVFSTSQGDRTGVPNIMILVTDSPTTAPVTEVGKNAKVLKDMGISVFSIGVEKADPMEISAMASEPISKYSYSAGTYYEMLNSADLKEKLSKAYPVFAGIGSPTDVSTTKKPGKKTKPTGTPIKKTKDTVKPQKKTITTSRADVVQETTTVAYKTSVMKTDIPTNRTVFSDLVKLLETSPYMEAITASVVRDTYTALPDTKEVITDGENLSRNLTTKNLLSQNVAPPISGSEKADIVFALHLSDRANAREVRTVLNYLNSLISGSDVENGRVKIGLLTYNADAEVIFNINQYNSVPLIRNEVLRIESRTRSSNVDASAALTVGTQMLNVLYSGRSDAPKALIFVTDSVSTENTELIPFERFRVESEQVNVFSVGIGLNGKEELEDLATAPENVLTVSRYSELPSTIDDLKRKIFAFRTRDDKAVPEPEEPRITKPEEPIRTLAPPRQEASGITLVPRNHSFVNRMNSEPSQTIDCNNIQIDLAFLIDTSSSLTREDFQIVKEFAKSLILLLSIDSGLVRISVATFSDNTRVEFYFDTFDRKLNILRAIDKITQRDGNTHTASALRTLRDDIFQLSRGDRPGVPNVAILITDGRSNVKSIETLPEALKLKDKGIQMYGIGIRLQYLDELRGIVSEPKASTVFNIGRLSELRDLVNPLFVRICRGEEGESKTPVCGKKQLDIVFILDSSTSVGERNFEEMIRFAKNVISRVDIDSGGVRIGFMTYSSNIFIIFNLNSHKLKADVLKAVENVKYRLGSTNTAGALRLVRTDMFTPENGDRNNVDNWVILITDGISNINSARTIPEAELTRTNGIRIFTIGIGITETRELKSIASVPVENNFAVVQRFEDLSNIQQMLFSSVCPAKCGSAKLDIIFVMDASTSVAERNFMKIKQFAKDIVELADVDNGMIRFGVVIYGTDVRVQFKLNQYSYQSQILNSIDQIPYLTGSTNTADALRSLWTDMFTEENGDRPGADNIAIVVTDGVSNINNQRTVPEAQRVKSKGIHIYVIGINLDDTREITAIASEPSSKNVYAIENFDDLTDLKENLFTSMCREGRSAPEDPDTVAGPSKAIVGVATAKPFPVVPLPLRDSQTCGLAKVDLVIILDASTSVSEPNYKKMLSFCKDFLKDADIDSGSVRVGIVIYSTDVQIQFHLNRYSTKSAVFAAIDKIPYIYGSTNTADGLNTMRTKMFTPTNGDRPDVNNVAIIITDGISNINARRTIPEAEQARAAGIHIYAIGIGLSDTKELNAMASPPASENSFSVKEFDELAGLAEKIFSSVCPGTTTRLPPATTKTTTKARTTTLTTRGRPLTTPTTATKLTPTAAPACGLAKVDLVIVLDASTSVTEPNYKKMLSFCKDFLKDADIDSGSVRVGIVIYSTDVQIQFHLNRYSTKAAVFQAIDKIPYIYGSTNTADGLKTMRTQMFTQANGDRPDVSNVALVMTDGISNINARRTIPEAELARTAGIHIYAIGIGLSDTKELDAIATPPARENSFAVQDFNELAGLAVRIFSSICPVVTTTPKPQEKTSAPAPVTTKRIPSTTTTLPTTKTTTMTTTRTTTMTQSTTTKASTTAKSLLACGLAKVDLVFILDASTSVTEANYKKMLTFCKDFLGNADIDSGSVRVGVVIYSTDVAIQFHLNRYSKKTDVFAAIDKIPYIYGSTNTADGLRTMRTEMFTVANGDRPDADNVAIIITDGISNINARRTVPEAVQSRAMGIHIYAIGIGLSDSKELDAIASEPAKENSFSIKEFDELVGLENKIFSSICLVRGTAQPTSKPPTTTTSKPPTTTSTTTTEATTPLTDEPETVPPTTMPPVTATTRPLTSPTTTTKITPTAAPACGLAKVDLVIVLDASTSVTEPNYKKMLSFCKDFLKDADIDSGSVRVGIVIYSTDVQIQFHLNRYSTKAAVFQAIDKIPYIYGSTNTADGLKTMRTQMFTQANGDRPDVSNVALVMTDGISNINARRTIPEAELARTAGIHIYAIGIGLSDTKELDAIATPPARENSFAVQDFNELAGLAVRIFSSICPVRGTAQPTSKPPTTTMSKPPTTTTSKPPTTTSTTTTEATTPLTDEPETVPPPTMPPGETSTEPPPPACADAQVDLVYILDASTSVTEVNFKKMLDFCKQLLEDADINNGNVQVGVVVYSSDVRIEFYLNRYKTKSDVMDAIGRIKYTYGSTNTAGGLKTMREELFSFRNGDRSDVPNVAIILTDGVSNINAGRTIPEAELARAEGIHIYAIGIGLTDTRELDAIASHPASQNSFSVRSFDELKAIKQKVFSSLCPVLTGKQRDAVTKRIGTDKTESSSIKVITTQKTLGETTRTTTRKPTTPKPTTPKPTTTTKATTTTTKPTTPKPTPSTTKSTTTKATTPKPTTPKPTPTTTKSTTKATTPKPTTPRPTTTTTRRTTTTPRRDGYDLVMVLDSSVNSTTFNWMMDVTKNTIRELNIDDEEWRVGIVTYSTNPNREFNLDQYKKKADVLRQVDRISYRPGQTNTASALKYVRTNMFRESNGDRNFAKNYVILITGNEKSQDMYAAAEESYQMQRDGVATYVIGLGINDKTELDELASLPLADYEVIIPAPNQIGETPGEVIYNIRSRSPTPNPPPQRPPRPRSTPGPVLPLEDLVCKSTGDIVFVLDSSGSVGLENFYRVLNFTYNTVNQLDIESGNYSVGLVTFSDSARIEFYLNTYKKRGEIQPALQKVRYVYGSTHTAAALRRVRQELFRAEVGDRPDVPNIVVIVTDGNSNVNHEMTLVEADMLKRAGVSMITVAVGFQRETRELVGLTSAPVEQNLIYADEYRSLDKLSRKLLEPLCTDSDLCRTTRPCRNDAICVDGIRSYMCLCPESYYGTNCEKQCSEPADVAFILDSSNTVGESSFQRMKDYVGSLIMEMNVEACNINVGLMKYSSAPMIQWGLGTYRDTDANIRAVNQVHYTRGVANMAAALKSLRTDIFNGRGGDRPKAKNIAYLLTDGSNKVHEEETQKNAELAISSGIRIIPVGVSLRDREDVDLIAGAQDLNTIILDENIGEINEAALAPMVRAKDYCAGNPCKNGGKCLNESFGFICECPAGFTGEDCTRRCSAGGDVVFVVDTSRYVTRKEMKRVRHFLRSVVKRLRFKEFKTGLVQYSNTANVVLTFADGDKKKNVLTAIAGLRNMVGDPDPAEALAKANFRIFKGDGAMADQPDYLVLLSKGLKNDQDLLIQSNRLKMRGTRILGVGVALTGSERELMESVVSYPSSNTAYYADDVEGLDDVADKVVEFMCNGQDKCAQNPCQNKGKCHVIGAEYYCDCPHGFAGKNCELKCDAKADIVFLLDSSGSVGHVDFRKVKDFAYRMIDDLNIGKDETRVGLVAYSSRSRHGFYLKDYYEKYELQNAISSIEFEYGKTNTADGLRHVREKLFNSAVGDRPDAQNFVVVITDGLSNIKSEQTIVEADLMKSNGVHVYAIGIGKFDRYEIDRIASAPASKNAFILEDYASLASISSDIIRATCKDPSVCDENPCRNDGRCEPTMNGPICKCTGGYRGPYCEMSCVSRKDIIFVLDSSSSVGEENFELALEFVSSVVEELSRGGSDNRYAMITFSNDVELVFSLGRYSSAGIILNAIKYTRYRPGSTNTAGGLRTALEISSPEYGDRKDVDNIVILVADGQSNVNTQDTIPAADDLKKTGAKIITIGVGLSNYKELETIGSGSENVYKVDTYNLLGDVKADILENSCSENE